MYLLCSPHNPTGTVHTAAELTRVARLAREHSVRVVVDEIHAPIVAAGATFVPFLSVPGAENGLSLMSASKAWNLAGLKAALAIAGTEAADDLARIPEEVSHGPSHLGIIAHTAALRDGGDWLDALLTGLDDNRRLLAGLLAEHLPAIALHARRRPPSWPGSTAGSWAWTPTRPTAFLHRGRVALNSGRPFGTGGEGFVRLNLATSPKCSPRRSGGWRGRWNEGRGAPHHAPWGDLGGNGGALGPLHARPPGSAARAGAVQGSEAGPPGRSADPKDPGAVRVRGAHPGSRSLTRSAVADVRPHRRTARGRPFIAGSPRSAPELPVRWRSGAPRADEAASQPARRRHGLHHAGVPRAQFRSEQWEAGHRTCPTGAPHALIGVRHRARRSGA